MSKLTKEQTSNLKLWESVQETNPLKTKNAQKGKLSLTAINAISQIKEATKHWGTYGDKWGLKDLEYSFMDIDTTKLAMLKAVFFYPNASFEISSSLKIAYMTSGANSYLKVDDDFMKKLETDITTKALSKLGFNSDVFMGLYDDNRYVAELKDKYNKEAEEEKKKELESCLKMNLSEFSDCKTLDEAIALGSAIKKQYQDKGWYNEYVSTRLGEMYRDVEESLTKSN